MKKLSLVVVSACILLSAAIGEAATLSPGDILVTDRGIDALLRIDPTTGNRSIVSSGAVGSGPSFLNPQGVAIDSDGLLLVADSLLGVLRVDPSTGDRTVLSTVPSFVGIAIGPSNEIAVASPSYDALFWIDPVDGDSTIFSGARFGIGAGPAFVAPRQLAIESGDSIFVSDPGQDALFGVNPATGDRTFVSSASVGIGPFLEIPRGIAIEMDGSLVVIDINALFRVDPVTGDRSIISSSQVGTGPLFMQGVGIALESTGDILVVDFLGGRLIRVAQTTGDRTILSSSSSGVGPNLLYPQGVMVVPGPKDTDKDGVPDDEDFCPVTVIPEGVPTDRLRVNRWALVDENGIFDTLLPLGGGIGTESSFSIEDTAGCSCEQIIEALGLGRGHEKFGCSIGAMEVWVSLVNP